MNYTFSDRISSLQPSVIREIFKVTQDKSVIAFSAGNPSPDSFPVREMDEISREILAEGGDALQYGITEGYTPLRDITRARYGNKYGIGRDFDDTIIVSGGQQGIELTTKVLVNEGDAIICEAPSFIGALNAFRSYKANLAGIPMDDGGIDPERLEQALKTTKNVRFIYLIPTFQNPSGKTMSLERRKQVLELAEKYSVLILEDSPYFELRYSGDYVPPIKSMDDNGRVIYCGSYSKTLSPGMRVGFVTAPAPIIQKIVVAKQVSDVHTNLFFMTLVFRYLEKYDIDAHIERVRELYRVKRDHMAACLEKYAPRLKFTLPNGGLFLWCELPPTGLGSDGVDFCRVAGRKKVAAVPGSAFSVDERAVVPAIRLNFSLPDADTIERGCKLLGEAADEYLK